nr:hypothetical transcript [Hymenolepis microstoma]
MELVFAPKMRQINKPRSVLTDCVPEIYGDNGSTERKQNLLVKSGYHHVSSRSKINLFQYATFAESKPSHSISEDSLLSPSVSEKQAPIIGSFNAGGSPAAISPSKSVKFTQPVNTGVTHDSNDSTSKPKIDPEDNFMLTADKILPLTYAREYTETKSFIAPISLSQENRHSDLLKDNVVYLKYSGSNQWALSSNLDPKVKQLLSSELYFFSEVSEILPIQQIESYQISSFHGSYQMAKIINLEVVESDLIFKTVSTLSVDPCRQIQTYSFEPIQPELLMMNIEMIEGEIKTDPYSHLETRWVEMVGYLHHLCSNSTVSHSEYESNVYRSDACFEANRNQISPNAKNHILSSTSCTPERSLASPPIFLEESYDVQEVEKITPNRSASNSAVPSSNSLNQDAVNQRMKLDLRKLKCHLLKVSRRRGSLSPSPLKAIHPESVESSRSASPPEHKADPDLLKSDISSVSLQPPVRDLKIIPRILIQDESQNYESNPLNGVKEIDLQILDETIEGTKLLIANPKQVRPNDSNSINDSTILIPEGYPGGLKDTSKTNDIYLNCKAIHGLQLTQPMEHIFLMKGSEISGNSIHPPEGIRKVIDQNPESDLNTPVVKINGSFTQRSGFICHVTCDQDNLICMFSVLSPGELEERSTEFLALASSNLLRLGLESCSSLVSAAEISGAAENPSTRHNNNSNTTNNGNRDSVYLLFDEIVRLSPVLTANLQEACFPYALIRSAYNHLANANSRLQHQHPHGNYFSYSMKSSLFKPVYFTKPVIITRTSSSNSQLVSSIFQLNSSDLNENVNHNSAIPDACKLNRDIDADVEYKDLYIARPSKGVILSHLSSSASLTRSLSVSGLRDMELVFAPKMRQINKPRSVLTDCVPEIYGDNGSTERKQNLLVKSGYHHVSSRSKINLFQYATFAESKPSHSISEDSLLSPSVSEKQAPIIGSFNAGGSPAAISPSKSVKFTQPVNTGVTHDSNDSTSKPKIDPEDNFMLTADKILPLTYAREYTETKSFIAPISLSQENRHSDLLKDNVVYLKYSGSNQWALSSNLDPKVKQLLSSELYFFSEVSEILPIQQIESYQISSFHGSYQMAKIINLEVVESDLIFKTVSTLSVDPCRQIQTYSFEPIQPELLMMNIEMIEGEIKTDPYSHLETRWVEMVGYLHHLCSNSTVSHSEYESNVYRSDACFEANRNQISPNAKNHILSSTSCTPERSLASPPIFLEESYDVQEVEKITPNRSASNSAVPSSNSLNQDAVNQRMKLDLRKLKCHLLKVSRRRGSLSPSPLKAIHPESVESSRSASPPEHKADPDLLKSDISSVSLQPPVRDLKIIPRILIQDESQNYESNPLNGVKEIDLQILDETIEGTKLLIANPKQVRPNDSNSINDSTILIPEGYPGGLKDTSKTNDIYLNCKAIHGLQLTQPMEHIFLMKGSEISGNSIHPPEGIRKVIDQNPESDLNTPVVKINGSFTQRTPASKAKNEIEAKFDNEDTVVQTSMHKEEAKEQELADNADKEVHVNGQEKEAPITKIDSTCTDKDESKQNLGKGRCASGITWKYHIAPSGRRSSSICDQEEVPTMEISQIRQNDYMKFKQLDARSLKEKELQELMEKCRELKRELEKLPSSRTDAKNNSPSTSPISLSDSSEKGHRTYRKRRLSTNSGKKRSGNSKKEESSGRRKQHQSRNKGNFNTSSSSDYAKPDRRYEHGYWLPPQNYPASSYAPYPFSPYPCYPPPYPPPPPPPPPQQNCMASSPPHQPIMLMDPWAYSEYRSSRHHHRHKPRRSSRHHHHRHRKASSSKHKLKKDLCIDKEAGTNATQNKIYNEGSGKLFECKAIEEAEYNQARQIKDPIRFYPQ